METTVLSVLSLLAATSALIVGLLRFLVWMSRTNSSDYQALAKTLDKEREAKQKALAERDEAKLKAMQYADQRDRAIRYAQHWRKTARLYEVRYGPLPAPSSHSSAAAKETRLMLPVKPTDLSDVSGIRRFELDNLKPPKREED